MEPNPSEQAKQLYAVLSETAAIRHREDKRTDWAILIIALLSLALIFLFYDSREGWSERWSKLLVGTILWLLFPAMALYLIVRRWSDAFQAKVLFQLRLLLDTDIDVNLTQGLLFRKKPARAIQSPRELIQKMYILRNWSTILFFANMLFFSLILMGCILSD